MVALVTDPSGPDDPGLYRPPDNDGIVPSAPALSRTTTVLYLTWPVLLGMLAPLWPFVSDDADIWVPGAMISYGVSILAAVVNSIIAGVHLNSRARREGQRLSTATLVLSIVLTILILVLVVPTLFFFACLLSLDGKM